MDVEVGPGDGAVDAQTRPVRGGEDQPDEEAEGEACRAPRATRGFAHGLASAGGFGGGLGRMSEEQVSNRLQLLARYAQGVPSDQLIVAPVQALMQLVPAPARLPGLLREVKKGDRVQMGELLGWLEGAGYTRTEAIEEPGEYSVRGGLVDVFPPISEPVRLDFFGDEVERITEIDAESLASDRAVERVTLMALKAGEGAWVQYIDLLPPGTLALLCETMEVVEQARGYFERITDRQEVVGPPAVLSALQKRCPGLAELNEFSASSAAADARVELPGGALPGFAQDLEKAFGDLAALGAEGLRVVVCCQNAGERQRFGELAAQHVTGAGVGAGVQAETAYLHRGFVWRGEEPTAFVPYHELLNRFTVRRRASRLKTGRAMDTFLDFGVGDYVVHQEHGIAKFAGMTIMKPREVPGAGPGAEKRRGAEVEEYLTLEYANGARLHVPAVQIDRVQKYVGGFSGRPPLSALGGTRWKNQKERVSESVRDLAAELLRVRAAREHMPGIAFPADTAWQREFEAEFPYTETEDQLAALSEIKKDMTRARPMDRLICGDVGFGKTELAIRAAFKAVESGRQVAVLVPTTVLAEQHERTFRGRFAGYPFRIESMSRFKSGKEASEILGALRKGQVDVVIGTHRLLSKDVRFADLGLVIVDEEQRFGVEHKDALLKLRLTVDVLTLSATPIPRTLHMAMLGLRDISSLTTAPLDRRAIVTEVIPYNEKRVAQAIAREMSREGQVFFVHNRVHDIVSVADDVRRLAPDAKIVVGHGQMAPAELEEVMLTFMRGPSSRGGADILVSTTIIESGIDIPTANTIIIKDADRFGLAELHQLRGRVGRSKHRAYCYLLLPPERTVKEIARKRLKAIEQYSMLGAGFKIAMRDLEIRGAGNILGPEQSGHIAAVGYDMYCRLLEEAVKGMSGEKQPDAPGGTASSWVSAASSPRRTFPARCGGWRPTAGSPARARWRTSPGRARNWPGPTATRPSPRRGSLTWRCCASC